MIYAYIRVSTDKQTVENQRYEIEKFARIRELSIDKWISETVSGTKSAKKRKLGSLIKKLKKGDTLIASEISRLGRRLMEVMSILNTLISQRTKEGLARRVAEGQKLGRCKGGHNSHYKLTGKESLIKTMLAYKYSKAAICRKLKCNPKTLNDHLQRMNVLCNG